MTGRYKDNRKQQGETRQGRRQRLTCDKMEYDKIVQHTIMPVQRVAPMSFTYDRMDRDEIRRDRRRQDN
jgi:hypothetical protein